MPKKFLIAVDTQVDFVMTDGKLPVEGAEAIIAPGIRFLTGLSPDDYAGVLFTFDTHREESYLGSPENLGNLEKGEPGFPLHCEIWTPGWANVFNPALLPIGIPYHMMAKDVFDMWQEEEITIEDGVPIPDYVEDDFVSREYHDRDAFFEGLRAQGIETIQVFGVASDFCVKWAIDGLVERGFAVEVIGHLTAGILRTMQETVEQDFTNQPVTII